MGRTVVYTGPTLPADQIRAALPDAVIRPPAGRGDLLAEPWAAGDTALIVDGFFRERRSVGHKEILQLLRDGVTVVGAASMGALRAAELSAYGMCGIGAIHRMYASGEIDGDDEVGVLHGPAEAGYPPTTVALVNLRHSVAELARAGVLDPDTGRRLVTAAKDLPFISRTWEDIALGLSAADADALGAARRLIEAGPGDLKHRDALAALVAVATGAVRPATVPRAPVTGIGAHQLLVRRTRREYAPGRWMSDPDVLDAARLFDPGYPRWHEQVLTGLLGDIAARQGLDVDAYGRKVLGDGAFTAWLTAGETELPLGERLRLVMVRVWPVWQSADWRPAMVARLRASERWQGWCDLVAEADEEAERVRYRQPTPPPAMCAAMFLRHWRGEGGTPDLAMARRGFAGRDELGAAVRRFFPYDVSRARASR